MLSVGVSCVKGAEKGDCATTHTLTAFEVSEVTSVRLCSGVTYLAAPGGPVVYESVACTDDRIFKVTTVVLRGSELGCAAYHKLSSDCVAEEVIYKFEPRATP